MLGYRIPSADQVMLVSGGKSTRVLTKGTFVPPGLRKVGFLSLKMREAEVREQCTTQQGIGVSVKAVIAFKVAPDQESIVNAGQRFLSDQNQMEALTGRIFAGHLRSIVGSMTMEEIYTQRQKLAEQVLDASKEEMAKLGLLVDSFQIETVDDRDSNGQSQYIEAMSAPHKAAIRQKALVAQAEADRAAAEAQQQSARKQAEYERETEITKAGYSAEVAQAKAEADQRAQVAQAQAGQATRVAQAKAETEINRARAEADQAGPLAQAKASQAVAQEQTALAKQNAELAEQQLVANVVKPAEADAQKIKLAAAAEAEATRLRAEAATTGNRVSLDQMLIEKLPEIVERAAGGLANSNLTVLNGADGLGEVVAGLVSQGLNILDTVKQHTAGSQNGESNGAGRMPAGALERR